MYFLLSLIEDVFTIKGELKDKVGPKTIVITCTLSRL